MQKLKYTVTETEADWEENLYHAIVPVVGGYVETDDPLTIESLLYRGFELVEEDQPARAKSARRKQTAAAA